MSYTVQVKLYRYAGTPTQGYNRDPLRCLGINWREHSPLKTLYQRQHKASFRDYSSRSRAGGRGKKLKIHGFGRSKKMKMVMVVGRKKEEVRFLQKEIFLQPHPVNPTQFTSPHAVSLSTQSYHLV